LRVRWWATTKNFSRISLIYTSKQEEEAQEPSVSRIPESSGKRVARLEEMEEEEVMFIS
jgi:hypothetical protein